MASPDETATTTGDLTATRIYRYLAAVDRRVRDIEMRAFVFMGMRDEHGARSEQEMRALDSLREALDRKVEP